MIHLIPSIVAFVATFLFIFLAYNFAVAIDLVDRPNHRKQHHGEIPLIGGIAVLFGFSLACLLSPRSLNEWRPLFFCMIPLAVAGVMDDHGDVSIKKRIFIQVSTCLIMIYYGNIQITQLGDIVGTGKAIIFPGLETLVTIFCVVGMLNALNLIDGIDGLCALLSLVALGGILVLGKLTTTSTPIALVLYFFFSLAAFLMVNLGFVKSLVKKVFLGDAGTTIIGFFLCWYMIQFSQKEVTVLRPITAVWLLAFPIMDTLTVMIHRFRIGESPFKDDRKHMHHLLLNLGYSPLKVLIILVSPAIMLAAIAVVAEINNVPEFYLFYGILFLFVLFFLVSNKLLRKRQLE